MAANPYLVPGVTADTLATVAASRIMLQRALPIFELSGIAATGESADAVHDMRVASRRLREAMNVFWPTLDAATMKSHRKKAKALTRALGPVRDSDVFLHWLDGLRADGLSKPEREVAARLAEIRSTRREAELGTMRANLEELDVDRWRSDFEVACESGVLDERDAPPISAMAASVLRGRVNRVYKHLPEALDPAATLEQHRMRVECKHLRYAVETLAPCLGSSFESAHSTLTAFQDALGEMHDADVFEAYVEMIASENAALPQAGAEALITRLRGGRAEAFQAFLELTDAWAEADMRALVGA